MARERKKGETLELLTKDGGAVRLPKKKQLALPHIVEEFLSMTISEPDSYSGLTEQKQAEIDREMIGFAKAQEKLREFIALCGVEANRRPGRRPRRSPAAAPGRRRVARVDAVDRGDWITTLAAWAWFIAFLELDFLFWLGVVRAVESLLS